MYLGIYNTVHLFVTFCVLSVRTSIASDRPQKMLKKLLTGIYSLQTQNTTK